MILKKNLTYEQQNGCVWFLYCSYHLHHIDCSLKINSISTQLLVVITANTDIKDQILFTTTTINLHVFINVTCLTFDVILTVHHR